MLSVAYFLILFTGFSLNLILFKENGSRRYYKENIIITENMKENVIRRRINKE